MDRNHLFASSGVDFSVALRKESVDRNKAFSCFLIGGVNVALRKESVDRNDAMQIVVVIVHAVALRKESVDRNFYYSDKDADWVRRSPQGERG